MQSLLKMLRLAFVCLVLLPIAATANQWQFEDVERIVAVADIHGAYEPMVATLRNAGVIDDERNWSGGESHLVIVGDILDRGSDSRDAMDLLMQLEGQADEAGGMVHVLIGNHEAMNLVGDLRYVAKDEFAAFAAEESAEERERWLQHFAAMRSEAGEVSDALRSEFDERYPTGFFGHRREFAADGRYGSWLLTKPVIVVINGTAFVHGGLSPMVADIGLNGVNQRLVGEMAEYVRSLETLHEAGALSPMDSFYAHPRILNGFMPPVDSDQALIDTVTRVRKLNESDLHASDGPLWYRGNVACCRVIEEGRLQAALVAIDAKRVVIGHTPTPGRRVLERLDGRIIEIDTGMLNERYGGSGNALVIEGDRVSVVNQSSGEVLTPQPHQRQVGMRPGGFLSADATAVLLATGDVSNEREDALGRTIVTVSDGKRQLNAVFDRRAGREFYPELAAYRLDRLLELDMVPVTVRRDLGRREGTLQFFPPKLLNEAQRSESGRGGSANCPLPEQWSAMYVFDTLIYNEGRALERMQYDASAWQLILVGHERAFGQSKKRPRHLESVDLDIGLGWKNALTALTDEVIEREFADAMDKRRRSALAARRDALLAE
ncbi:MAG: metallophosphoesterase [Woeseiaceae bacterium]